MNGAMADPLVSTISAPNPTSATMTGSSQNFLRWLRNPHRSRRNSTTSSVRFLEIAGPVCVSPRVHHRRAARLEGPQTQRIVTEQPPHEPDGRDDHVEH